MVGEDEDDATVPTERAGIDPLIARPKLATGHTGQIERPGDQTPWWFVPGLCAVGLLLVGLLVVVADRRSPNAVAIPAASVVSRPGDDGGAASEPDPERSAADIEVIPPAPTTTLDPRIAALPGTGSVRFGGSDREILARCEVHLPFDPADTEVQTSSYFFFDASGISRFVDRITTPDGDTAELLRDGSTFVDVVDIGDDGAFAATFTDESDAEFEVVVNPGIDSQQDCGDRVVTNAPGQFSEPHTRIVLDVCIDDVNDIGRTIAGATSQGARFEILQAGGELAEIVFDPGDGGLMRTTAPAFVIRNDGILSVSGVVSDGTDDLDITIDLGSTVGEADARRCSPSDRL